MLRQYHAVKLRHPDCIIFFRLGDFYEMFYDDAKLVSGTLDLVLTSRGKGSSSEVPMCGFPYHSAEGYIAKLIKQGHKVAICEQMEDPALAKGIVKRDVTRVISAGTYLDENNDESRLLLSLSPNGETIGVSFTDVATGAIQTNQFPISEKRIVELIAKLSIQECIFPQSKKEKVTNIFDHPNLRGKNIALSPFEDWCFNPEIARKSLCEHFGVHNLHGFGIEDLLNATASSGALLEYLKQMNKKPLRHMDKISLYADSDYVYVSPAAVRGLELETLVKTFDNTLTAMGRRKLSFWLYHPLKNLPEITERQNAIILLKDDQRSQQDLKTLLDRIPDVEKNISRISCGYTHARDLLAIRNTLSLIPELQRSLRPLSKENSLFSLEDISELRRYLENTINEEIPLSHPEGKIIKTGFHKELDSLRDIQNTGREWLKKFQEQEIKKTGINSLKVGFTNVFGYYIEITRSNLKTVPDNYIRKQTLVNAERFITEELKTYEEKILTAQDKILKIENEIIKDVEAKILDASGELHIFCQSLATIDCIYSLAQTAQLSNYILPKITENSTIEIKDGRHPVVERLSTQNFVPNDTFLDCENDHLIILTGPNMAGKSTYIRQTAILVILAQAGSFIPARSAHIGLVDKIFTRIGAHDDISKGQSTFMVEMNETADILNNLSAKSLVILDEIGRGTSTYDGLSLAWALAEHFQKMKVRTLFATHFHELTALSEKLTGIKNYNVAVKEWKDEVVFLHKIVPGGSDDSYGIYVAKLAGIPQTVISRAKGLLTQLELKNDLKEKIKTQTSAEEQLRLFVESRGDHWSPATCSVDPIAEEIKTTIEKMDVDNLTPIEALNRLNKLKQMVEKNK